MITHDDNALTQGSNEPSQGMIKRAACYRPRKRQPSTWTVDQTALFLVDVDGIFDGQNSTFNDPMYVTERSRNFEVEDFLRYFRHYFTFGNVVDVDHCCFLDRPSCSFLAG